MMRGMILLVATVGIAWAQAPNPELPMGSEYAGLLSLLQAAGPYGTILVLAVLLSRLKLPAVPLRVDGPLQLQVMGPVELSGRLDCRDPSARTCAEDPK